jgi:hypothetical protein
MSVAKQGQPAPNERAGCATNRELASAAPLALNGDELGESLGRCSQLSLLSGSFYWFGYLL